MKNIRFQLMNHILSRKYSKYYQLCDSLALAVEPEENKPAHRKAAALNNHKQHKCVCLPRAALSLSRVSALSPQCASHLVEGMFQKLQKEGQKRQTGKPQVSRRVVNLCPVERHKRIIKGTYLLPITILPSTSFGAGLRPKIVHIHVSE